MTVRLQAELIVSPALDCLRAVAMPENLQGMALALAVLKSCIDASCQIWPTTPGSFWASAVNDAQAKVRDFKQQGLTT